MRLYARIYRGWFDVAAAERRLGNKGLAGSPCGASGKDGNGSGNGNGRKGNLNMGMTKGQEGVTTARLRAQDLVDEMKRRVKALARLRQMVERGDVTDVSDDDLWVLYFMLIENGMYFSHLTFSRAFLIELSHGVDGKNAEVLFGDHAIVHLPTFLELYHRQHLLAAAVEPGYPEETIGRSLAMWIAWLVLGSGTSLFLPPLQCPSQSERKQVQRTKPLNSVTNVSLFFALMFLPLLATMLISHPGHFRLFPSSMPLQPPTNPTPILPISCHVLDWYKLKRTGDSWTFALQTSVKRQFCGFSIGDWGKR